MTKLTPALLTELKEKAEKATPGPYDSRCREFSNHARSELWTNFGWLLSLPKEYYEPTIEFQASANPETVLLLVNAISEMKKALETYAYQDHFKGVQVLAFARDVLLKYFGEDK